MSRPYPSAPLRQSPRSYATRIALIEEAEKLFAGAGIDGVSTRQLGAAIGSANNNVVAYYFGSKEAVVEAVYRHRLPQMEQRRRQLLAGADAAGNGQVLKVLLNALYLPFYEQTDDRGRHSYADFLGSLRYGWASTFYAMADDYPATQQITERIKALLSPDVRTVFNERFTMTFNVVLCALRIIDETVHLPKPPSAERLFADAIEMVAAAISCPLPAVN